MTNGNGGFTVTNLRKGQYAFGNGDVALNVQEPVAGLDFTISPNPAVSYAEVVWPSEAKVKSMRVFDSSGRFIESRSIASEQTAVKLNVEMWSAGMYSVVLEGTRGKLGSKSFLVD